jgi:hypothetical protein
MTSPNNVTPEDFLSSTGLAAFAAKTRADWEAEQKGALVSSFTDAQTGFAQIRTWIDRLVALLTTEARAILKTLLDGLAGITNFDAWVAVLKSVINAFKGLFDALGSKVWTVLNEVITFFSGFFTNAGDVTAWLGSITSNLLSVVGKITGQTIASLADGLTKLESWTQALPNTGSLISGLLGSYKNPVTGTNNTLPDLVAWASQLLTASSVIPSFNLFGSIPAELLSLIGAGHIGDVTPNLVTDAGFSATTTLQAGLGWSWDGTTNSTGSTGGSARVACDGGVKYLFSNQIAVAPGQQLTLSTKAKFTKGSSATATIICGIRAYNGDSVTGTQTISSLAAASGTTTSVGLSGADSNGFKTITGTYTVPANTTSVRLVLGTTVGTTGTVVWFDEASLIKTNKIDQTLVTNLTSSLSTLLPATTFQALLDKVTSVTGATAQQVKDVLDGKLTSDSQLTGSNIVGNISSAVISELRNTWSNGQQAIENGALPTSATYGDFASALKGWGGVILGIQSLASGAVSSIDKVTKTASGLDIRATDLERRMLLVEAKAGATTQTPPTTPTIIQVSDNFERASLTGWTVSYSDGGADGSRLNIFNNSGNAEFGIPGNAYGYAGTTAAAIWAGSPSASVSQYQKITATYGSKAGGTQALFAGTPGFNDLIGRAASYATCLICRLYPNGEVKFLYRYGSWTEVQIGSTQKFTNAPTTGTQLNFYCGDKNRLVNGVPSPDQKILTAQIGTETLSVSFNDTSGIFAGFGLGWGFGMGHGLSVGLGGYGAFQGAAVLYDWKAQEQV